jgi:hypothetical protein
VLPDQHLGDARARVIELCRTVCCFAEQDDTAVGEALGESGKLVEIAERLGRVGDDMAQICADDLGVLGGDEQAVRVARRGRVDLGRRLRRLRCAPAFLADQRHEGHRAMVFLFERVLAGAPHQH